MVKHQGAPKMLGSVKLYLNLLAMAHFHDNPALTAGSPGTANQELDFRLWSQVWNQETLDLSS